MHFGGNTKEPRRDLVWSTSSIMDPITWLALKPCKRQCYEAKDRLSQLPDDILLSIISSLTMKEAARISVLSHRLNYVWRCFPVLIFEDHSVTQERSSFFRWVNRVVEAHVGSVIDEFRASFDYNGYQSDVDKWMVFALAKHVKILELDFLRSSCRPIPSHLKLRIPSHNSFFFKSRLTNLCLKHVNVTSEDIEFLLLSCTVLKVLCIQFSPFLTHVTAFHLPLQLKHLRVSNCQNLRTIDILAPKLLSFTNHGFPIELHIRNASLLSDVSVGDTEYRGEVVAYAFDSLSKYSSQLESLSLHMSLCYGGDHTYTEFNLGINNPPVMTNLKHLKLHVNAKCEQSLLGWADLIEACPILLILSVKFSGNFGRPYTRAIEKRNRRPLKSLKILEFSGNLGLTIDLEFMTYVVENAIMLEYVFVEYMPVSHYLKKYVSAAHHDEELEWLKRLLPEGVILKTIENPW